MRGKRIAWFLIVILIGLAGGLAYGWLINPAKFVNADPSMLRSDYKANYVLMVAEIYHSDQDLKGAERRLEFFGEVPPARSVAQGALTARQLEYSAYDLELIADLQNALESSPSLTPTIGTQP